MVHKTRWVILMNHSVNAIYLTATIDKTNNAPDRSEIVSISVVAFGALPVGNRDR